MIPHEFVVFGALTADVTSAADGIRVVWSRPGAADRYSREWDLPA
ncbi:hypothetical protein ACQPZJ_21400 [Actinoplanes sp. CA-054009]